MPTDFRHNNSLDDFSRRVGETLQKHTLPVDDAVWSKIEEKLSSEKKRPLPLWWAVAGIAAIFAGVLFFTLPFSTRVSEKVQTVQQKTKIAPVSSETIRVETEVQTKERQQIEQKSAVQSKNVLVAAHRPKESAKETETETETEVEEIILPTESIEKSEEKTNEIVEPQSDKMPPKTERIEPTMDEETEEKTISAPDDSPKKHQLIARLGGGAVGGGGMFSNESPVYGDMTGTPFPPGTNLGDKDKYENGLQPSDYSEVHHLPPVSASVMVEFPINQTWSVESGLIYTYLVSKYSRKNGIEYRGRLYQHYLGVPVNLKANVWQGDLWRVYVLGGGAAEKGITSLYKQEIIHSGGQVHHFNRRAGIKGFQFSGHVAAGFDYKINDNVRIFGEPYLIYYFKNNQPMSSRTEDPLTLGINAGIRIQFK